MSNLVHRELKRALKLSPIAIPVGGVIAFVGLTIFIGSPFDTLLLIVFSVLCTAGVSLIIWFPVCYVLGYAAIVLMRIGLKAVGIDIGAIFDGRKSSRGATSPQGNLSGSTSRGDENLTVNADLTREQVALINYIRKAQQKGVSNDLIRHNLGRNGWATDSIRQALRLAEQG